MNQSTLLGIQTMLTLLSALAVRFSSTFISKNLIPANNELQVIESIWEYSIYLGLLAVLVINLVTPNFFQMHLKKFLLGAVFFLFCLLLFQLFFVHSATFGDDTKRYLIGFAITEEGVGMRQNVNPLKLPFTETEYIESYNHKRIPIVYGWSYYLMVFLYSSTYIAFIACIILTIGSVVILTSENVANTGTENDNSKAENNPPNESNEEAISEQSDSPEAEATADKVESNQQTVEDISDLESEN